MKNVLNSNYLVLSAVSLIMGLSYLGVINNEALAQNSTLPAFANNTETIANLEKLLGSDQLIIINGTSIANPDNTLPDSVSVNIAEDCMKIPNSKHTYCP